MSKIIEVANLRKSYQLSWSRDRQANFEALKGISFSVEKGEIFGILGPNGAGKTTTLEILEGLRQQTSGKVTVLGFDNLLAAEEIKKRVGIQLQSSQYMHHLTLGELLDLFASLYKYDIQAKTHDRTGLLRLVNLEDKEHETVDKLSGGQKQRFTIATSLVHNPQIIFLDEPTTGLDPSARRQMWQLIKQLNAAGITVIITTHYMEEAEFLCHRVAIMDGGKILEIDEPKKLIDRLSDTTQISFFCDKALAADFFKEIPEIKKVYSHTPKMILEITSLDKISSVVNLLKTNKIMFYGFTVKTASLEDVYLDLTGKEYEE